MATVATPNSNAMRRSRVVQRRRHGRRHSSSAMPPPKARSHATPTGLSDGNTSFASAEPT